MADKPIKEPVFNIDPPVFNPIPESGAVERSFEEEWQEKFEIQAAMLKNRNATKEELRAATIFVFKNPQCIADSDRTPQEAYELLTKVATMRPSMLFLPDKLDDGRLVINTAIDDEALHNTLATALNGRAAEGEIKSMKEGLVQKVAANASRQMPEWFLARQSGFDNYFGGKETQSPMNAHDKVEGFVKYMEAFHKKADKTDYWATASRIFEYQSQKLEPYLEKLNGQDPDGMTMEARMRFIEGAQKKQHMLRIYGDNPDAQLASHAAFDSHVREAVINSCHGVIIENGKVLAVGRASHLADENHRENDGTPRKDWLIAFRNHPLGKQIAAQTEGGDLQDAALTKDVMSEYSGPVEKLQKVIKSAAEEKPYIALGTIPNWSKAFKDKPELVKNIVEGAVKADAEAAAVNIDAWLPLFKDSPQKIMEMVGDIKIPDDPKEHYHVKHGKAELEKTIIKTTRENPQTYPKLQDLHFIPEAPAAPAAPIPAGPVHPYSALTERSEKFVTAEAQEIPESANLKMANIAAKDTKKITPSQAM